MSQARQQFQMRELGKDAYSEVSLFPWKRLLRLVDLSDLELDRDLLSD